MYHIWAPCRHPPDFATTGGQQDVCIMNHTATLAPAGWAACFVHPKFAVLLVFLPNITEAVLLTAHQKGTAQHSIAQHTAQYDQIFCSGLG